MMVEDGDLEIFIGTTNGLVGIDLKDVGGDTENYWHQYRNGNLRNGYVETDLLLNNFNIEYPDQFMLFAPYPNPFNPISSISYYLKEAAEIQISVHDITGRKITIIENTFKEAGYHSIDWNAYQLSSGQYFINLKVDETTLTKPVTLLK